MKPVKDYAAHQANGWERKDEDTRRALCEQVEPLIDAFGRVYPPDFEACMESGYKCWGTPVPESEAP